MGIQRLTLVSTWEVHCGIAGYTRDLKVALENRGIECNVLVIDRGATRQMSRRQLARYFKQLGRSISESDVAHVQHEFGLFNGRHSFLESLLNLQRLLKELESKSRCLCITFHSPPPRTTAGIRNPRTMFKQLARQLAWERYVASPLNREGRLVVVPSRLLKGMLAKSGFSSDRIKVIPQGVPFFHQTGVDRVSAKLSLGYNIESKVLVIFGFLAKYKGHLLAIKALGLLPEEYSIAVVGGTHPMGTDLTTDDLFRLSKKLGVQDRLRVTGFLPASDVETYFRAADLCLAPYVEAEGSTIPTSAGISWALASGRPVVATKIPMFLELHENSQGVHLVDPGSPDRLAAAILELEGDERYVKRLVRNARVYCEEHSWNKIGDAHIASYENAIAGR